MEYRIGVDIGGTSVKLAVVDSDFNVINKLRFPTGENATSEGIIKGIIENCRALMAEYPVTAIGIGSAGRVDQQKGTVVVAGNLPFRNEPVVSKVSSALGVPAFIDNDGYTALIGERAAGVCKGCEDALIITIGTGIGGAILLEGRLIRGRENRAGELGHFIVKMDGIACECGLKGCFERYASATGLIEQTEEAVRNNPDSILAKIAENGIDGKTAFDAKEKGCPVATELLAEYGRIFAAGLNSLIHIFQPQVIAVSGGVSNQGEKLLEIINPHLLPNANVKTTTLKGDGGIIGAALLGTEYAK